MERLKLRTYGLGATLVVFGAVLLLTKEANAAPKTEEWMVTQSPDRVESVQYQPGDVPGMSYKMDKVTYDTLHPFGIVSRVYNTPDGQFDAVLIASRSKNSFHDPRVCFSGQGYTLEDQKIIKIPTQSRGEVPATFTHLGGRNGGRYAIFCYKGPNGFVDTTMGLKVSMFLHELLQAQSSDGVFYRFIAMDDGAEPDKLIKFVGAYLDEANKSSKGYF